MAHAQSLPTPQKRSGSLFSSSGFKIFITAVVFVAGAGFLVYSSLGETVYYKHVDEVLANPQPLIGQTLRVHGFVEAGSIHEAIVGQNTKRDFVLTYKGSRLLVRSEGPKPDTFKDLAEVVAKGKILDEGGHYVLAATELSAKCPSKYQGAERTQDFAAPPPAPNVNGRKNTSHATTSAQGS
ncbi:MAG TPA: cytochrome c maturation protein CcmE [Kofleriaceae bacterium]|nr:cytochrome c maturation protein CcmE [Kofleriaceae bacterium]